MKKFNWNLREKALRKIIRIGIFLAAWGALYPVAHYHKWVDIHLEWVNDTWVIGLIIGVSLMLSQLVVFLIRSRWRVKREFQKAPNMLIKISDILIYILAIKMILLQLDMNITPILTAFGVTSLAVGLAMQSSLSDFFAGLQLISDPMYQLGDFIEINEFQGTIIDITWRSTHLKTFSNTLVIVPNSIALKGIVTNYTRPEKSYGFIFSAGISYYSTLEEAEKSILEIASEMQSTLPKPYNENVPLVRFKAFNESNIDFMIKLTLPTYFDSFPIRHELIKSLKKRFDVDNIEISFPCTNVYLRQNSDKPVDKPSKKE
ncbi:MAG TPA: mechanosensitive ion channel family protein [Caldisericia bacterium]|jgi:small-conductance mechanosensitive channel|nr:mechanosensitive ion channel family protein [Caldisericia bacterium]